jgi:hypothetical protein
MHEYAEAAGGRGPHGAWEYCCLWLDGDEKAGDGRRYDLFILYLGATLRRVELAGRGRGGRVWDYNPFYGAIAQLGQDGWELVTVQHGDSSHTPMLTELQMAGGLRDYHMVAYFKRPAQSGRDVDEPPLELP